MTTHEVIRMNAEAVGFHLFDSGYDCRRYQCDTTREKTRRIFREGGEKRGEPGWVESLQKKYRGADRLCLHTLTGRISAPKICIYSYECYHCPYDQMLDEQDLSKDAEADHTETEPGNRPDFRLCT